MSIRAKFQLAIVLLVASTAVLHFLSSSFGYKFFQKNRSRPTTGIHPRQPKALLTQNPLRRAAGQKEAEFQNDEQVKHWKEIPKSKQFQWTSVDSTDNTRLYSAYLDERDAQKHTVLVLGLHDHSLTEEEFFCAFQYPDRTSVCLEQPAKQWYLNQGDEKPHHNSWAFALSCDVPLHKPPPIYVFISKDENCDSPRSNWIPISNTASSGQYKKKVTFGVCIETPLFGKISLSKLIQGIEWNLAFGAEWLTVYVQQAPSGLMKVLKDYERNGILEIVEWNLSQKDADNSHYYAESVSITDCLYRNMYRVKYLAFTDLDEIIVPQKHRNWSEMMLAIDQKNVSAFVFSHTAFVRPQTKQNTRLDTFLGNWTCNATDNGISKQPLPLYIIHNYRSPPYPYLKGQITTRQKVIVKPQYIASMGIHAPHCQQKHKLQKFVASDVGLLYHYRVPPLCQKCEKVLTRDERIQQLFPDLFFHIRNKICQYP